MRPFSSFAIALLLCNFTLAGCNGPASVSSMGAVQQTQALPPLRSATSTPSPIPFSFQTVDDSSSNVNKVTGINQSSDVVGTIGASTPSSPSEGYLSDPPYSSFQPEVYSGAQATAAMSLSSLVSNLIVAGYVVHPPSLQGTWAFVRIFGLWTLFKDGKGGKGPSADTQILGINDSEFGAGFYTIVASGVNVPVVINIPLEQFTTLKPPGAKSAEATGINDVNDVSGWESTKSGITGFLVRAGIYYSFAHPSAPVTEAFGLNGQDQIVGYYQGSSGVKHGFILTGATSSQQTWQKIDEPNATQGTVVTGINNADDICGYYVDASGIQHGFVAVPK